MSHFCDISTYADLPNRAIQRFLQANHRLGEPIDVARLLSICHCFSLDRSVIARTWELLRLAIARRSDKFSQTLSWMHLPVSNKQRRLDNARERRGASIDHRLYVIDDTRQVGVYIPEPWCSRGIRSRLFIGGALCRAFTVRFQDRLINRILSVT